MQRSCKEWGGILTIYKLVQEILYQQYVCVETATTPRANRYSGCGSSQNGVSKSCGSCYFVIFYVFHYTYIIIYYRDVCVYKYYVYIYATYIYVYIYIRFTEIMNEYSGQYYYFGTESNHFQLSKFGMYKSLDDAQAGDIGT